MHSTNDVIQGGQTNAGTLFETNIAPENPWLEDEIPFVMDFFEGLCWFQGLYPMIVCVWNITFDFLLFDVSCNFLVIGHLKWCLITFKLQSKIGESKHLHRGKLT